MTLQELMDYIVPIYQFNPERFPPTKGMSDDEVKYFATRHLAMHHAKTAGKLVTFFEDADHDDTIDYEMMKPDIAKALLNTLRLASLVGYTGEELTNKVKEYVK